MNDDAAERLLAKLRRFVAEDLEADERAMFAALVAPAVAKVWADSEVEGYGLPAWSPEALPAALRDAMQRLEIRIEDVDPDQTAATGSGDE